MPERRIKMNVEKDDTETIDYKGHTIHIKHDTNCENPREWDNFGTMVCFHRRYTLGDKHEFSDPDEFRGWYHERAEKITILPLFLLDHSGITMRTSSFNDYWDSGQVGWIYIEDSKLMKEFNLKEITDEDRARAKENLIGEVKTYDQYLTGQIFGYMVEGPNCEDSCWGYYGTEAAISEGKGAIDWGVKEAEKAIAARDARHVEDSKEIAEILNGYELLTEYQAGAA